MNKEDKYHSLLLIAKIIAERNGKTAEYVFTDSRLREVVDLRSLFFYFATRYTRLSLSDIGKFSQQMGRKQPHNHATVIHNANKIKDRMSVEKDLKKEVAELDNQIKYYVDYDKFWYDELSRCKQSVVRRVHRENDLDFMTKFETLSTILHEHKDFLDVVSDFIDAVIDVVDSKYRNKLESKKDEGIYQTTQKHTELGVV